MKPPRSPAARRVMQLWADSDRRGRFHTTARWWSAPFAELELEVPLAGDILEVGCGHGVLSTYLAITSHARRVVGIDIDADKILLASEAILGLRPDEADLRFEVEPSGVVPPTEGGWRSIVIADVLYLLGRERRDALLAACVDALAPGGLLVIKEVDTKPLLKARISQLQELISTKVLRITDGHALEFASSEELVATLVDLGMSTMSKRIDHGYLHPHCVVLGTKPVVSVDAAG
ncbi:MAG: methyltransferase domain-containing protein [Actinobacteria bacterium]|nr:methyltransferase domain-containing protein [Actinomycetota bacterium]MTA78046.1 methyltransferase domain-containing protein [Actinomycetota bacterium]